MIWGLPVGILVFAPNSMFPLISDQWMWLLPFVAIVGSVVELGRQLQPIKDDLKLFGLSSRNTQIAGGLLLAAFPIMVILASFSSGKTATSTNRVSLSTDPRIGVMFILGVGALLDALLPVARLFDHTAN